MESDTWVPIAVAIIGVVGTAIFVPRTFQDPRDVIKKDFELISLMTTNNAMKAQLIVALDQRIALIIQQKGDARRDPAGIVLGILFAVAGGWLTWRFGTWGAWWYLGLIGSVPMLMLGIFGFVQDVQRVPRNAAGRRSS